MADLAFSHPELARRYELLVALCWAQSWDVSISSSSRSEATQRAWYALYLKGEWIVDGKPAIVADPDRDAGPTPFGWHAKGSMHMIQQDGYSHALDLGFSGGTHDQLHELANRVGLRFVEPTEWWHCQAFDAYSNGFFPVEEDDMNKQELADAIGARVAGPGEDYEGKIVVPLLDHVVRDANGVITATIDKDYPLADALSFDHRELKLARLQRPGNTELS